MSSSERPGSFDKDIQRIERQLEQLRAQRNELDQSIDMVESRVWKLKHSERRLELSARHAVIEVLRSAGDEDLTLEEVFRRVRLRTNKGSIETVLGYLERGDIAERVSRWRSKLS